VVALGGALRVLASAGMATVVIAATAVVLIWAMWIDWQYGLDVAGFFVYSTRWFAALLALLGVNVLAAAVVRFPWRRRHVGFLLVHAGILVVLVGCWLSARGGIDATLSVFEGDRSSTAYVDAQEFTLSVAAADAPEDAVQTIRVPFRCGPFNWNDYAARSWFPWHLPHRDQGVLWDRDGVKLEVLDYCSDSNRLLVPRLVLRVARRGGARKRDATAWISVPLSIHELPHPQSRGPERFLGSRAELGGGAAIVFRAAASAAETAAFRDSRPEGPLGRLGQVVLHARGKKFTLLVEDLQGKAVPLGETGLSVELGSFDPEHLIVQLLVRDTRQKDAPAGMLMLGAIRSDLDLPDLRHGVSGSYWFDAAQKAEDATADAVPPAVLAQAAQARIDILQGHDEKLYYRVWRSPALEAIAELPSDGQVVTALDGDTRPVAFWVSDFTPAASPGVVILPVAFRKGVVRCPRARVRLTVDGKSEEFWLANRAADVAARERIGQVEAGARSATVTLGYQAIPLGFEVELVDFVRKLDPGTPRPSHYSSRVNLFVLSQPRGQENAAAPDPPGEPIARNVVVELNRPFLVVDPLTGQSYRLFQSSFAGPFVPGEAEFDQHVGGSRKADEVYRSVLSVTTDPGRSWKYAGCLMIIAGIAVMYYMKAYFFQRRKGRALPEHEAGARLDKESPP